LTRAAIVAWVLIGILLVVWFAVGMNDDDSPRAADDTAKRIARRIDHAELCRFERTGRYTDSLIDAGIGSGTIVGLRERGLSVTLETGRGGRDYLVAVGGDHQMPAFVQRNGRSVIGGLGGVPAESC
jgi:hypothetical protein